MKDQELANRARNSYEEFRKSLEELKSRGYTVDVTSGVYSFVRTTKETI